MEQIDWNRGLLHSSALVVIGAMAIVAGRSTRERLFAIGLLAQGIAIFLVTGGTFFGRADFDILAAVMLGAVSLWGVWMMPVRSTSVGPSPLPPPNSVDDPKDLA